MAVSGTPSPALLDRSVLVVCTKDRPDSMRQLLQALGRQRSLPHRVLIVDSSLDTETFDLVAKFRAVFPAQLDYLSSLPGLPHQRNMGIAAIAESANADKYDFIHFIDDDVVPANDYFEQAVMLLEKNPQAVCVGGHDEGLPAPSSARLRDALFLGSARTRGKVLKSGIAVVCIPIQPIEEVDWVPGHSMNFRSGPLVAERFDGRARMYGEDIEMQLRIAKHGTILCAKALRVRHFSESASRDQLRVATRFDDGFRWELTKRYPTRFSRAAVVSTTVLLGIGELVGWVFGQNPAGLQRARGHTDFLWAAIRGNETQQLVDHPGSGPFSESPSR